MTEDRPLPRVVACMPAWNAAGFIGPVLESLAAQTYQNLQVLISVDACADGTAEICDAFAMRDRRFRVIRQSARLGWIGNTNALLQAAAGDYLFFAFHDDPLKPHYVARLVAALEEAPSAVLAFADIDSNLGPCSYRDLDGVRDRYDRARCMLLRREAWWVPNRGLMRASAVRAAGLLERHFAGEYSADWPWLLRLALLGEFVRVPEPLLMKTFRAEGLSSSWRDDPWKRIAVQLACLRIIRQAGFPLSQELRLHGARILRGLKEERWQLLSHKPA